MATSKKPRKPVYTTYSCPLCDGIDSTEMVQCDSCQFWFHFSCVNVTGDVANRDWSCRRCESMMRADERRTTNAPIKSMSTSSKASKCSSKVSSLSTFQRAAALKKLDEEQAIKLDILNRKYALMSSLDERDDESVQVNEPSSMDYTLQWAQKLQDVTSEFANVSMRDDLSISLSDHERETINLLSSEELKANVMTSTAVMPTQFVCDTKDATKSSVLTSVNRQPSHLFSEQSKSKIDSEFDHGSRGLQFADSGQSSQYHGTLSKRFGGLRMKATAESTPKIQSSNPDFHSGYGHRQEPKVKFDFHRENTSNQLSTIAEFCPKNFAQRSSNANSGVDRGASGEYTFSTDRIASVPIASTSNQSTSQPSAAFTFRPSMLSQSNTECRHQDSNSSMAHGSGYVSNTTGTLTKNQIAARHVFKDLPEFHGRAKDWPIFLSALKSSTEACGYSDAENLGRLQRSLKHDAKDLVISRLLHANSVPGVIETLHLIYGRPNVIIHELLEKINETPPPQANDLYSLIKFAIAVQNLCGTIESTGRLDYLRNPLLMQTLIDKLPTQIRLNWAYFKFGVGDANLSVLGNWLYQLAQVATDVVNPSYLKSNDKKHRKEDNNQKNTQSISYTNAHSESGSIQANSSEVNSKCRVCDSNSKHQLDNCRKFKQLSVEDRWNLVKQFRICGGCFGNHHYFKCKSKKRCGKDGCVATHHTLLHNSIKKVDVAPSSVPETKIVPHSANSHRSVSTSAKFPDIFRIVPVILSNDGKSIRIFAYLDDGSNLTSLEESVATKIGASGTKSSLCVLWSLGNTHQVESQSKILSVVISGAFDGAEKYSLDHVRTVKKLNLPSQSITRSWLDQYPHLTDIPIATYNNATPQMIIGLQYSKLMVSLDTIEGNWAQPIVCRTRLGWVIQGPNDKSISNEFPKYGLNMCECQSDDNHLHQLVKEFFSVENFGVKASNVLVESKELSRAKILLETKTIKQGNRYVSALLWKSDNVKLPDSFGMALRRLECVESRMKKDPVLAERMCLYIVDFIEKGYIRLLSKSEQRIAGPRTWYLPIFPVFNSKKPEKLRVVWDGAAKVRGQSLNSNLLVGPDLLVPLPDILRRFRLRKIGITGDIKEMFHQILVDDTDQQSQRFLWRNGNSTLDPDVYVMRVMTFGSSCSPSIAQFVKNKNAMDFIDTHPRAVEAITKSHYVDDMIESAHSVEEAIRLVREVQYVHQHAGFELRSFNSNSKEVLRALNGNDQCGTKILDDKINFTTERVLGLYWNTELDTFTYCLKFVKVNKSNNYNPTKREVLSAVMSIFDPLGFLAHFVVRAKILLQDIWRSKIEWDDALPAPLTIRWKFWLEHLPEVEKVHIPRLYSTRMSPVIPKSIQLHLFVDASLEAFSAVAYFRVEDDHGVDSCLVEAKSKVAPIKPMSVPRLELQGAVLGTRLSGSIIQSHHDLQIDKTIVWCDSKTVLSWIKSDPRRYNQFVTFRVAEILDSPHDIEWRWIPSQENVADEATKSKKVVDLSTSSRWFVGPKFLRDPDANWTFELDEPEFQTDEELRSVYLLSHLEIPVNDFIDFKRFSNWQRLVRSVAYVQRFISNLKSEFDRRSLGVFSSHELLLAESFLYRKVQYDCFQEELVIMRHNETAPISKQKDFPKNSFIRTCSAYFDDNGVMRMKGRIDSAVSISESAKRPIILDRHHYVTHLIVNFYHRKYKHLHHQTVLNEVRQKFWIPKLRVVLGSIRNNCQKCKNTAAVPKIPEMAPLPDARLAIHTRPFTFTGIDYFGPIPVVFGRGTAKRWGVLITCLTTRAIHLEIAHSLDTSSCIMAIYNFIGRRGQPKAFYSDNGTNFHGADNTLREEFKKLDKNRIQEEFTTSEFSWSFNPPAAPHMGGSWERMIQIVKNCLDATMTSRYPTDEVLKSLFIEAENIVNSRPLTYVSLDSPNDDVLTPNHFLIGSSNGYKPPGEFTNSDLLRNNWRTAQAMADKFWNTFVLEFLPTIMKRTKWFKKVEPLKVGDVVLIIDENFKRNTWPKGLVVEVYQDKHTETRSARVRTDLGTFLTRPVSKLAVLDVRDNLGQQVELDVVSGATDSIDGKEDVANAATDVI